MRKLPVLWRGFAETVSVVAFAMMFAGFVIGVGGRYVFNEPVAWSNELCAIGFVWIVFWTSDILLKYALDKNGMSAADIASKAWRTQLVRATSPKVPICGRPEGP